MTQGPNITQNLPEN